MSKIKTKTVELPKEEIKKSNTIKIMFDENCIISWKTYMDWDVVEFVEKDLSVLDLCKIQYTKI